MTDWLTRMRQQPKSVRNQFAIVTAFVSTACIATVWLISAPFSGTFTTTALPETKGAWAQFTDRAGAQLAAVWESLDSATATTSPAAATSSAAVPAPAAVVVPKLSTSTITTLTTPPAKTILIATSSQASDSTNP